MARALRTKYPGALYASKIQTDPFTLMSSLFLSENLFLYLKVCQKRGHHPGPSRSWLFPACHRRSYGAALLHGEQDRRSRVTIFKKQSLTHSHALHRYQLSTSSLSILLSSTEQRSQPLRDLSGQSIPVMLRQEDQLDIAPGFDLRDETPALGGNRGQERSFGVQDLIVITEN